MISVRDKDAHDTVVTFEPAPGFNSAAETVEWGHVNGAERVQALADFSVGCAVDHQASDGAQLQETLAKRRERGVYVAYHGIDVIPLKDVHGAVVFIDAVFVNQCARLGTGGGNDGGDQCLEFSKLCGFDRKGEQAGNMGVHGGGLRQMDDKNLHASIAGLAVACGAGQGRQGFSGASPNSLPAPAQSDAATSSKIT